MVAALARSPSERAGGFSVSTFSVAPFGVMPLPADPGERAGDDFSARYGFAWKIKGGEPIFFRFSLSFKAYCLFFRLQ